MTAAPLIKMPPHCDADHLRVAHGALRALQGICGSASTQLERTNGEDLADLLKLIADQVEAGARIAEDNQQALFKLLNPNGLAGTGT